MDLDWIKKNFDPKFFDAKLFWTKISGGAKILVWLLYTHQTKLLTQTQGLHKESDKEGKFWFWKIWGSEKIFGLKKFWAKKNFRSEKILCQKKILGFKKNKFWVKKFLIQKKFCPINFGSKKFEVRKNSGSKKILGFQKNLSLNKYWVWKNSKSKKKLDLKIFWLLSWGIGLRVAVRVRRGESILKP